MSDQMSEVPVEEQLGPPPEPPNVLSLTPVEVKSEELEQNDGHEDHEEIDMSSTLQPNEEQESQQKEINEQRMESHETRKPEEPLQESHEEQEPQEEEEEDNRHEDNEEHEDNDEDDDNEDDYDNEEHDDNDEHEDNEDNEEPEQMIYEMDVNLLKEENQKLSEDVQFAQNIIKLLENYRNLMIVCLNNCQNCAQNQVLVQEFNELELTYDKDLNYAKDIVFDKSFYNKINRIFNKKKKNPNERKYEILDDYIESDSDEKNSLDPIEDSDYEPIEEPLVENDEKPKKRQKRTPKAKKSKTGRKRTKKTRNYDIIEEEIDDIIDHLGSNVEEEEQDMAWNPSQTKRKGRGRPKGSTPKTIKVKG